MPRARLTHPDGIPRTHERAARDLARRDWKGKARPGPRRRSHRLSSQRRSADCRPLLRLRRGGRRRAGRRPAARRPGLPGRRGSKGPLTGHPQRPPLHWAYWTAKSEWGLLSPAPASARITVDPGRPRLAEAREGQPAALTLAGGWLAACLEGGRPGSGQATAQRPRRAGTAPQPGLPPGLRRPAATPPRDAAPLALAPAGLVDPETASALVGCSVAGACTTLDDFVALGSPGRRGLARCRSTRSPAVCTHCSRVLAGCTTSVRPSSRWPGPACWSGPCGCSRSAVPSPRPDSPQARQKLFTTARCPAVSHSQGGRRNGLPADPRPALLASARLAVGDGELDTLARRLMSPTGAGDGARTSVPQAAAPDLYDIRQPGPRGGRAPRPAPRAGRRPAQPRQISTPATGRTADGRAGALPGRAGRRTPRSTTRTRPDARWNP